MSLGIFIKERENKFLFHIFYESVKAIKSSSNTIGKNRERGKKKRMNKRERKKEKKRWAIERFAVISKWTMPTRQHGLSKIHILSPMADPNKTKTKEREATERAESCSSSSSLFQSMKAFFFAIKVTVIGPLGTIILPLLRPLFDATAPLM